MMVGARAGREWARRTPLLAGAAACEPLALLSRRAPRMAARMSRLPRCKLRGNLRTTAHARAVGFVEEDLEALDSIFTGMDRGGSGQVSLVEMLDLLNLDNLDKSPFTKRVFRSLTRTVRGRSTFTSSC